MKSELVKALTEEIFYEHGAEVFYHKYGRDKAENIKSDILICNSKFEDMSKNKNEYTSFIDKIKKEYDKKLILPVGYPLNELMVIKEFKELLEVCKHNNIEIVLEYLMDWTVLQFKCTDEDEHGNSGILQMQFNMRQIAEFTGDSPYLVYCKTKNGLIYTDDFEGLPKMSLGIRFDGLMHLSVFDYILEMKKITFTLESLRVTERIFNKETEQDVNTAFEELLAGEYHLSTLIVDEEY